LKKTAVIYKSSDVYPRHFYFDADIAEEILSFIRPKNIGKSFDYVVNRILTQDLMYYDNYQKLKEYTHLSEMRICPNHINARIYCKEITTKDGGFHVVAAKLLLKKKSRGIDKAIDQFIQPIQQYEYRFG